MAKDYRPWYISYLRKTEAKRTAKAQYRSALKSAGRLSAEGDARLTKYGQELIDIEDFKDAKGGPGGIR